MERAQSERAATAGRRVGARTRWATPAGPGTRAAVRRIWLWPGALLVLACALFVRGHDLDRAPVSPTEEAAFVRAATWALEPAPVELLAAPAELATVTEDRDPHGALVRAASRAGRALGFSGEAALRLDAVLAGTLAVLLVMLALGGVAPREPLTVLAGGALAASQLGAVWVSRLGTGEGVAAALWFAALLAARRLQRRVPEGQLARLAVGAALIAAPAALAVLFDPRTVHHAWVLGAAGILLYRTSPNGARRWPWASARVGAVLVAAGAAVAAARLAAPLPPAAAVSPWTHVHLAAWPVLLLAPLGAAGAFTRDPGWAIWLLLWTAAPPLIAHGAGLPRAHPASLATSNLFLLVLAAEGVALLWGLARHRVAVALAHLAALGVLLHLMAVTWASVHGDPTSPWALPLP